MFSGSRDIQEDVFNTLWEMLVWEVPDWNKEEFRQAAYECVIRETKKRGLSWRATVNLMIRICFNLVRAEVRGLKRGEFLYLVENMTRDIAEAVRKSACKGYKRPNGTNGGPV